MAKKSWHQENSGEPRCQAPPPARQHKPGPETAASQAGPRQSSGGSAGSGRAPPLPVTSPGNPEAPNALSRESPASPTLGPAALPPLCRGPDPCRSRPSQPGRLALGLSTEAGPGRAPDPGRWASATASAPISSTLWLRRRDKQDPKDVSKPEAQGRASQSCAGVRNTEPRPCRQADLASKSGSPLTCCVTLAKL